MLSDVIIIGCLAGSVEAVTVIVIKYLYSTIYIRGIHPCVGTLSKSFIQNCSALLTFYRMEAFMYFQDLEEGQYQNGVVLYSILQRMEEDTYCTTITTYP